MWKQGLIVGAVLVLAACTEKRQNAMTICKDLEAAGIAERCHDTSATICKYARERVTFYTPGGSQTSAGQVLLFGNDKQRTVMTGLTENAKTVKIVENRGALMLVQLAPDAGDDAVQKAKAIVDKLPAVPASAAEVDPTCVK